VVEAMDVPKVGRIAVLRDPQGATFGIIRPEPGS
jgi:predicted enzyme related to lactoylglutathione lyase